jgi:hypothetical protein
VSKSSSPKPSIFAKRLALVGLCLISSHVCEPKAAFGQKAVASLPRAHAVALQRFLATHPNWEFLSDENCDPDAVRFGRKEFGASFTPYYRQGDFNRDGRPDFAMVLVEDTPPRVDPGRGESDRPDFNLVIVVFNGQRKGGYRPVFVKRTVAPLACFLGLTYEKKRRLDFGIFETCAGFIMTPVGDGYILETQRD